MVKGDRKEEGLIKSVIEIAELLQKRYPLKSIALNPIVDNARSYALRAEVEYSTGKHESWCVKRHQPGKSLARVQFEEDITGELMRSGFTLLAAPVTAPNGEAHFQWENGLFSVYNFVDSDDPFDWKKMTWGAEHCLAAGQALAAFHAASRRIDVNRTSSVQLSSPIDALANCIEAKQIANDLEAVSSRKKDVLVHGDFQPGNVLFRGSGVKAIVDFDYVTRENAYYDLAFALLMFCVDYSNPTDACLVEDFVNGFLSGYSASLDRDELNDYLRIACMLNLIWLAAECKKGEAATIEYAVPLQAAHRLLSSVS